MFTLPEKNTGYGDFIEYHIKREKKLIKTINLKLAQFVKINIKIDGNIAMTT